MPAKPNPRLARQTVHRPKYDYKCTECHVVVERDFREATFIDKCYTHVCDSETRLFTRTITSAPFVKPMMHEHFNNAVGKPISSMRQFTSELARASDAASEELGMEHRYAPLEYGDKEAFGATGDGIHESNMQREKQGMPLLPEIT